MGKASRQRWGYVLVLVMIMTGQVVESTPDALFVAGAIIIFVGAYAISDMVSRAKEKKKLVSLSVTNNCGEPAKLHCKLKYVGLIHHHHHLLNSGAKHVWNFQVYPSTSFKCNVLRTKTAGGQNFQTLEMLGAHCLPSCEWKIEDSGLKQIIPNVNTNGIDVDFRMANLVTSLRMVYDSCQLLGIIVKFRTAFEAPGNGVFKTRELVRDPKAIAKKYFQSGLLLELVAALPLPQAYVWFNHSSLRTMSTSLRQIYAVLDALMIISLVQSFPKIYVLVSLKNKLMESGGAAMRSGWAGALYYLLTYMMLSQLLGSVYYQLYMYRLLKCRRIILNEEAVNAISRWDEMLRKCGMDDEFEKGLLSDIHKNNIGSRGYVQRYMYCFSWGLKCLSSMGQNFETSASVVETTFSFLMTISGLVLFAGLVAQMQTSIQSVEPGEEQQIKSQQELEDWTNSHHIPPELKKRLQGVIRSNWRALRGLDDETVLNLLPPELQCEIRRHLYIDLVCNLPFFAKLDQKLVHSFCGYLRTFSCSKGTFVFVEGEPVRWMLLIFSGELEASSIDGGTSNTTLLGAGDLCGSELLTWASLPPASSQSLPSSSQSVKCLTDVEAFSLFSEDLKLLGIQLNYCPEFQQAMRYQSQ